MKAAGMTVAFLVPVKAFRKAKSRLVPLFPEKYRGQIQEQLGLALFKDLVDILVKFNDSTRARFKVKVIFCGNDERIQPVIEPLGEDFMFLDESAAAGPGLDDIIDLMNRHAIDELGARGTIVLVSDLPLLETHDLIGLFKHFKHSDPNFKKVLLSPSLGNGCNMIARFPPDIIKTRYADKNVPSFIAHVDEARKRAAQLSIDPEKLVDVYRNLDIYLDLDTPDDLMNLYHLLKALKPRSRLFQLLRGMNVEIAKSPGDDTRRVDIKVDSAGEPVD